MTELRCAFVGCGGVAREYLPVYRNAPGVRVCVCVDIDLDRAREAARYLGAGGDEVLASIDFCDALAAEIDLLIINTPNHLHCRQAVAALRLHKHVFLQKPIASTVEEALAILAAARESRGRTGVYMSYFDQPIVHDFREMAAQGWFGEITQMHGRLMHANGLVWSSQHEQGNPSWRGSVQMTGGGAFIQLAVHYLRMMCWITGQAVTRVTGFASNLLCNGLEGEDTAVAAIEFESGAVATLNVSWCANGEEFSVHGSTGTLTYMDNERAKLQSARDFRGHVVDYTAPGVQHISVDHATAHKGTPSFNQHLRFLEAIRSGEPEFVSVETAARDMVVVEAFYESVRTGGSVEVATALPAFSAVANWPLVDSHGHDGVFA